MMMPEMKDNEGEKVEEGKKENEIISRKTMECLEEVFGKEMYNKCKG